MKTSCLANVHASHASVAAINPCRLEKPHSLTPSSPFLYWAYVFYSLLFPLLFSVSHPYTLIGDVHLPLRAMQSLYGHAVAVKYITSHPEDVTAVKWTMT